MQVTRASWACQGGKPFNDWIQQAVQSARALIFANACMDNPQPQDLEGKLEELTDKVDEVASTIKDLEEEKKDEHEKRTGFKPLISGLLLAFQVSVVHSICFAASWEISYLSVTATTAPEGSQVLRTRKY